MIVLLVPYSSFLIPLMNNFNPTHIETTAPLPKRVLGFRKLVDLYLSALWQVPDHRGSKDDINL